MLRLETFGGLNLSGTAGTSAVTQRRRLALLVLLAAAGERGISRDKLIAFLWPESPAENARHGLEQLLYALRRQLSDELLLGIDPLRVNGAILSSDVAEFDRAIAEGALLEAVRLYRGPFLDGFYVSDAPDFEQWCESERARLAGEYARALYRLAKEAGQQGQHTTEIDWWRRLSHLEPLNERTALGLARALVSAGDQAGALRHVEAYQNLVREELSVPATPEVAAFVERIRAGGSGASSGRGTVRETKAGASERYPIVSELGRGGMATVYLARDIKHDRMVALKVLRAELASSTDTKRFLREISIAARLHHPHILQLFDSGTLEKHGEPPRPFYVMPYVRGASLTQRLERESQLPLQWSLRLAAEIADALAYAHGQGIIHRDIKPGNILLESEHALVADFGIARALDMAAGEKLSRTGMALGSPTYMSPEQAAGSAELDGRSDIYSLGCLLYEMLAGEPPFTGRTSQVIIARHASDPVPSLRTVCPSLPPAVERAVMRALAKSPAERFRTAAEFAEALLAAG
ncbi:MAG TPA: protein kinase [Gemmatimonadales bacterium]|jgi:serine/threonine-protein kinase